MKEEIQKELAGSLGEVSKWMEATKDFAVEQAPMLVTEMIRYQRCVYGLEVIIFTFLTVICGMTIKRRTTRIINDEEGVTDLPIAVACSAIGFISFFLMLYAWEECLKVWIAPRLYVIEQIQMILG